MSTPDDEVCRLRDDMEKLDERVDLIERDLAQIVANLGSIRTLLTILIATSPVSALLSTAIPHRPLPTMAPLEAPDLVAGETDHPFYERLD